MNEMFSFGFFQTVLKIFHYQIFDLKQEDIQYGLFSLEDPSVAEN